MGTPVTRDERSVSRQKQLGHRNQRRAKSVSTSPVYDTGAVVDSDCVLLTDAPSLLPRFDTRTKSSHYRNVDGTRVVHLGTAFAYSPQISPAYPLTVEICRVSSDGRRKLPELIVTKHFMRTRHARLIHSPKEPDQIYFRTHPDEKTEKVIRFRTAKNIAPSVELEMLSHEDNTENLRKRQRIRLLASRSPSRSSSQSSTEATRPLKRCSRARPSLSEEHSEGRKSLPRKTEQLPIVNHDLSKKACGSQSIEHEYPSVAPLVLQEELKAIPLKIQSDTDTDSTSETESQTDKSPFLLQQWLVDSATTKTNLKKQSHKWQPRRVPRHEADRLQLRANEERSSGGAHSTLPSPIQNIINLKSRKERRKVPIRIIRRVLGNDFAEAWCTNRESIPNLWNQRYNDEDKEYVVNHQTAVHQQSHDVTDPVAHGLEHYDSDESDCEHPVLDSDNQAQVRRTIPESVKAKMHTKRFTSELNRLEKVLRENGTITSTEPDSSNFTKQELHDGELDEISNDPYFIRTCAQIEEHNESQKRISSMHQQKEANVPTSKYKNETKSSKFGNESRFSWKRSGASRRLSARRATTAPLFQKASEARREYKLRHEKDTKRKMFLLVALFLPHLYEYPDWEKNLPAEKQRLPVDLVSESFKLRKFKFDRNCK